MDLKMLDSYNQIVLQCHDNPDADTIASGFGLYTYFSSLNKDVRLIYSGNMKIHKSNLKIMVNELHIPIEFVEELDEPELLITVDCQYGEGNVKKFGARNVAIIDHHDICCELNELTEIRNGYGSCATLVYALLCDAGFDVNSNTDLATALYYGLFMDTNGFSEIKHPLDMDMIEDLRYSSDIIERLKNTNFSLEELEIAGVALLRYTYQEHRRFAIVRANPCDPNILGLISDLILQVESIDTCVVFNELNYGYKMSVRSCIRDAKANDIAVYLTENVGNGGGHGKKAGGFIVKSKFSAASSDIGIDTYLLNRMNDYFGSYEIFDTKKDTADISLMKKYEKLPLPSGYICTTNFSAPGTLLNIRTLEGDVSVVSKDDIYIMIGISGEVYPIKKEKFELSYRVTDGHLKMDLEYIPTAKNKMTGEVYRFLDSAGVCIPKESMCIYARPTEKTLKVFSKWDYDNYMLGASGDYFAVRCDDTADAYIVKKSVFESTYKPV